MSNPTYAVKLANGTILPNLSWTNASEQVRLYGAEWVHDYDAVLATAQEEAKKNSNTSGNVRKLSPEDEARINAPDLFAAAQQATAQVAEKGSSDLADMTREELFDLAAEMKVTVDKRTGHAKLVDILTKAKAEASSAAESEAAGVTENAGSEE